MNLVIEKWIGNQLIFIWKYTLKSVKFHYDHLTLLHDTVYKYSYQWSVVQYVIWEMITKLENNCYWIGHIHNVKKFDSAHTEV